MSERRKGYKKKQAKRIFMYARCRCCVIYLVKYVDYSSLKLNSKIAVAGRMRSGCCFGRFCSIESIEHRVASFRSMDYLRRDK